MAAADLDGDGKAEIVATNQEHYVTLWRGGARPGPPVELPVYDHADQWVHSVALADVNGDDRPDVLAFGGWIHPENASDRDNVVVLVNRGDGTFLPPSRYALATSTRSPGIIGDVDGDGLADVVNWLGESHVLRGNGDGTFRSAVRLEGLSNWCNIGDLNGDGMPDLLNEQPGVIRFWKGERLPCTLFAEAGFEKHSADLDLDGRPDVFMTNSILVGDSSNPSVPRVSPLGVSRAAGAGASSCSTSRSHRPGLPTFTTRPPAS